MNIWKWRNKRVKLKENIAEYRCKSAQHLLGGIPKLVLNTLRQRIKYLRSNTDHRKMQNKKQACNCLYTNADAEDDVIMVVFSVSR
jgi:hypothetical protein